MPAPSPHKIFLPRTKRAIRGVWAQLGLAAGITASLLLPDWSFGATGGEPARVRLAASLFDDVVKDLLPFDAVLGTPLVWPADGGAPPAPTTVSVTELRYCGVTDKGNGRLRAVLRAGAIGGSASPVLNGDDGCRGNLEDLTKRLAAHAGSGRREDASGIAEVEAIWRSWELRLIVVRIVVPAPSNPGGPKPLAGIESRRDLQVVSTAGLRVVTDAGDSMTFHVAPSFLPDAIDLLVVVGEGGAGPNMLRAPAGGQGMGWSGGGMNVAADLPPAFANQVLRQLTAVRPLAISLDREVIDVRDVSVALASTGMAVTGIATPRSVREGVHLTVQFGGDESGVLSIRAESQTESCTGLGMGATIACNARNAGRGAAAAALAAALTGRYQGQMLRDLAGSQTLRIDVGAHHFEFSGEVSHVTTTARGLSIAAHFAAPGGGAGH